MIEEGSENLFFYGPARIFIVTVISIVILLSSSGYAGSPERKDKVTSRDLIVGEILLRREGARGALNYYNSLLPLTRRDERMGFVYYRVAKINYARGEYQKAFENVRKGIPLLQGKYLLYSAMFLRMKILNELGWFREARQVAQYLLDNRYVGSSRASLYLAKGVADIWLKDAGSAAKDFEDAYLLTGVDGRPELFADVSARLSALLRGVRSPYTFRDALLSLKTLKFRSFISYLGAKHYLEEKMYGFAGYFLMKYRSNSLISGESFDGGELEETFKSKRMEFPLLSVYLPFEGPIGDLGFAALTGLELAAKEASTRKKVDVAPYFLDVHDTEGDTALLARELGEGNIRNRVLAVVGPLTGEEKRLIYPGKEDPPLFFLGQEKGGKHFGLFNFGLKPSDEAEKLLGYAFASGIRKVLLLYPDNGYGRAYRDTVTGASMTYGVKIEESVGYSPEIKDFTSLIRKVSGKKIFEEFSGLKERDVSMPVNFDGIFILDFPDRGFLLHSQMVYYNVKVATFVPSSWGVPDFLRDRSKDLRDIHVALDFNYLSSSGKVKSFLNAYRRMFGVLPDRFAGYGYDLGTLVGSFEVNRSEEDIFEEEPGLQFRLELSGERRFEGVTGGYAFYDGEIYKKVSIVRVDGGRITEVRNPVY